MRVASILLCFFFFNDPPTTEIYTLSLHDALPILGRDLGDGRHVLRRRRPVDPGQRPREPLPDPGPAPRRSEEHTSELHSHSDLVCRLLLEKKNTCSCCVVNLTGLDPR